MVRPKGPCVIPDDRKTALRVRDAGAYHAEKQRD
jgi:hypothetical protein